MTPSASPKPARSPHKPSSLAPATSGGEGARRAGEGAHRSVRLRHGVVPKPHPHALDAKTLRDVAEVVAELERLANPVNVAGMARFGITGRNILGISVSQLRLIARRIGRNHTLAGELWTTGIFEARILSAFIADPARLTLRQARAWTKDFESWADCDGVCIHLFRKCPFAHALAIECSRRKPEFVKRTGFTLMATLAVHDRASPPAVFLDYLTRIAQAANDDRNGVKKAVNWALRQIGKRDPALRQAAIRTAESIREQGTPAARWIASDALRELRRNHQRKAKD